jgi:endonuclease III
VVKRRFSIDLALRRIERTVDPFPKAAMFQLAADGFDSPFEQLLACIISTRTRDEVTLPAALRLFDRARSPAQVSRLDPSAIDRLITPSGFHATKARQIHEISGRLRDQHGGALPCESDVLRSLPGVGPKCANLVLAIACGQSHIGVDVHVARVANRWGYVKTTTPKETNAALEAKLPRHHWIDINRLLVPFGKHVCTPRFPRCSACPLQDMCRQVGVTAHR